MASPNTNLQLYCTLRRLGHFSTRGSYPLVHQYGTSQPTGPAPLWELCLLYAYKQWHYGRLEIAKLSPENESLPADSIPTIRVLRSNACQAYPVNFQMKKRYVRLIPLPDINAWELEKIPSPHIRLLLDRKQEGSGYESRTS